MTRCAKLLSDQAEVDFVDVNCGCPIDLICNKCALTQAGMCKQAPAKRSLDANSNVVLQSCQADMLRCKGQYKVRKQGLQPGVKHKLLAWSCSSTLCQQAFPALLATLQLAWKPKPHMSRWQPTNAKMGWMAGVAEPACCRSRDGWRRW